MAKSFRFSGTGYKPGDRSTIPLDIYTINLIFKYFHRYPPKNTYGIPAFSQASSAHAATPNV
jgi:hypothetical protein